MNVSVVMLLSGMFERKVFMIKNRELLNQTALLAALLVVAAAAFTVMKASGHEVTEVKQQSATEQWEYLAVSGPSTGLTPIDNPRLRKEPNVSFGREAFALEQLLDKLGANGWELVAVAGPATDPAYYFKRRK
jgi:hypothetical protein